MNEMVEQVARAICAAQGPRFGEAPTPASVRPEVARQFYDQAQKVWVDQNWRDYVEAARATIAAMEPFIQERIDEAVAEASSIATCNQAVADAYS